MKIIKKFCKWIYDNKEWFFSGIGITMLTMLLTIYTNSRTDTTDVSGDIAKKDSNIEIMGDNKGNIYQNSIISYVEVRNDKEPVPEIIMSESKYLEYLDSKVYGEIVFHYYDDYDGDGECEMFALVGEYIDHSDLYSEKNISGRIWFVNQNGIMEIESEEIEYWSFPRVFSMGNTTFISFEKYYPTGSLTYVWGVRDKKPYQANISGKGNGLIINGYNEIEITCTVLDAMFFKEDDCMLGRTWKKYYFYFDGNSFREYGGKEISIEDILNISNFDSIVDEIHNNSYRIDSVYYRENGIININISKDLEENIKYNNITIRYDGKKWNFVKSGSGQNYGDGIYLKDFIPSVATHPDEYPY